jgi:transaldolase
MQMAIVHAVKADGIEINFTLCFPITEFSHQVTADEPL